MPHCPQRSDNFGKSGYLIRVFATQFTVINFQQWFWTQLCGGPF